MRRWQRWMKAFRRFSEGRGFAVLTVLCVATIAATAVWTSHQSVDMPVIPTLPPASGHEAAALIQQSLHQAVTPTPLPGQPPVLWHEPLESMNVLRPYAPDRMLQSGVTGIWAVHPALDLSADAGTPVHAMADGVISAAGEDAMGGCWVAITHDGGYVTRYGALRLTGAWQPGDKVRAGDTIGFVGNSLADESDLGPHLHLEVTLRDEPVDPMTLFQ